MARMPGQPIDDAGKPVYPSNMPDDEDDVQGHRVVLQATGDDDEDKDDGKPHLAV